ncbi:MAG: hypothetical protein ACC652_13410, partial [Acidimicrobiales bacterium]
VQDPADLLDINAGEDFQDFDITTAPSDSPRWVTRMLFVALVFLALLMLWAVSIPLIRRSRTRRRRSTKLQPKERVQNNWEDISETLGLMGIRAYDSETRTEFAERVSEEAPLRSANLTTMAAITDRCVYRADENQAQQLARVSTQLLHDLDDELDELCSASQRIKFELDPRPLVSSWPGRIGGAPEPTEPRT